MPPARGKLVFSNGLRLPKDQAVCREMLYVPPGLDPVGDYIAELARGTTKQDLSDIEFEGSIARAIAARLRGWGGYDGPYSTTES